MLDLLIVPAFNLGVTIAFAAAALTLAYFGLRWLDRRADNNAWPLWDALKGDPNAVARYLSGRFIGVCLLIGLVIGLGGCGQAQASQIPDRYDDMIQEAAERYWPGDVDWRYWKAQLYQESLLDPDARSPVGAAGIAQFMPGTWSDIAPHLGYQDLTPYAVKPAINAGAFYMARLAVGWSAPRPEMDRWDLARASYNAGFGNLLNAQRACGGPPGFAEIMACLPEITGRHSAETITYVERIHRWYRQLTAAG